jgi:hypothetical protein
VEIYPRRSLSLQSPIWLPLGAQVPRDLLQRLTLFWTSAECALEEFWLVTLACECGKRVPV